MVRASRAARRDHASGAWATEMYPDPIPCGALLANSRSGRAGLRLGTRSVLLLDAEGGQSTNELPGLGIAACVGGTETLDLRRVFRGGDGKSLGRLLAVERLRLFPGTVHELADEI